MYDETQNNRWAVRCYCGSIQQLVARRMAPIPGADPSAKMVCNSGHVTYYTPDAHVLDWRHANRHQPWRRPFNTGRGNHEEAE